MQEDITAITTWSFKNKLPISLSKRAVLHYGNKKIRRKYTVICSVNSALMLECCEVTIFLTIILIHTPLRATRLVDVLMKAFWTRKPEFPLKVYKSYVRPVVEYVSQVWSSSAVAFNYALECALRLFTKHR